MPKLTIGPLSLEYAPQEQQAADIIAGACQQALTVVKATWGLAPPADCRIYVMTSWMGFVFRSAPWPWKILLGATLPLWVWRIRRTWPISAAWTQRYGQRVAIGVKPPRLLAQSNRSIGRQIFVEEPDLNIIIRNVTCHELVHACSAHLKLPMWLNEGLAILTTDCFAGKPTVRRGSLALVREYLPKAPPPTYRQLSRLGLEAIAYHSVRGYWLVRYLEAIKPGMLAQLFSVHQEGKAIEQALIAEMGLEAERFWSEIDGLLVGHFEQDAAAGGPPPGPIE